MEVICYRVVGCTARLSQNDVSIWNSACAARNCQKPGNGEPEPHVEPMRPAEIGHHRVLDHDIFTGPQHRSKKNQDGQRCLRGVIGIVDDEKGTVERGQPVGRQPRAERIGVAAEEYTSSRGRSKTGGSRSIRCCWMRHTIYAYQTH